MDEARKPSEMTTRWWARTAIRTSVRTGETITLQWTEELSDALYLECTSWDAYAYHRSTFRGRSNAGLSWEVRLVPDLSDPDDDASHCPGCGSPLSAIGWTEQGTVKKHPQTRSGRHGNPTQFRCSWSGASRSAVLSAYDT